MNVSDFATVLGEILAAIVTLSIAAVIIWFLISVKRKICDGIDKICDGIDRSLSLVNEKIQ